MVEDSGTTVRADRLRPLNTPRPMRVQVDGRGKPTAVRLGGQGSRVRLAPLAGSGVGGRGREMLTPPTSLAPGHTRVAEILDRWRIDDEWWRKPVSRMYFHVALEGGQLLTLFHDLATGRWYGQTSATPLPGAGAQQVSTPAFGTSTGSRLAAGSGIQQSASDPTPIKRAV